MKKNIVCILSSILFLFLIFYKIDFTELFGVLQDYNLATILPVFLLFSAGLILRGIRLKSLLGEQGLRVDFLAGTTTVGSMLNIFLPARAGDFQRAFAISFRHCSISKAKALGSTLVERGLDGVSVFLFLIVGILLVFREPWVVNLAVSAGFVFIGSLVVFYAVYRYNKVELLSERLGCLFKNSSTTDKIKDALSSFVEGFAGLANKKVLLISMSLSLLIWSLEAICSYFIIVGFGLDVSALVVLFIISLTALSSMIPSVSVFVGPYQYAFILALGIFAVSKETALALALVQQVVFTLITVIWGIYYIFKYKLFSKPQQGT